MVSPEPLRSKYLEFSLVLKVISGDKFEKNQAAGYHVVDRELKLVKILVKQKFNFKDSFTIYQNLIQFNKAL